jgi:hypothetical protein
MIAIISNKDFLGNQGVALGFEYSGRRGTLLLNESKLFDIRKSGDLLLNCTINTLILKVEEVLKPLTELSPYHKGIVMECQIPARGVFNLKTGEGCIALPDDFLERTEDENKAKGTIFEILLPPLVRYQQVL